MELQCYGSMLLRTRTRASGGYTIADVLIEVKGSVDCAHVAGGDAQLAVNA
jgi:hypothetical protein